MSTKEQSRHATVERQKEIVQEARRIVAESGMPSLTIKAISNALGITDGAIYRHFRSKKEILEALIRDIGHILDAEVDEARPLVKDPKAFLARLLYLRLSAAERMGGSTLAIVSEILKTTDQDLRRQTRAVLDKYLGEVRTALRQGREQGMVDPQCDPRTGASAFFGIAQGAVTLWKLEDRPPGIAEGAQSLFTIFWNGVSVTGQEGPGTSADKR